MRQSSTTMDSGLMLITGVLGYALRLLRPCLLHRGRLQDREEGVECCPLPVDHASEGAAVHHGSTLTCRVKDMLPDKSLHTAVLAISTTHVATAPESVFCPDCSALRWLPRPASSFIQAAA